MPKKSVKSSQKNSKKPKENEIKKDDEKSTIKSKENEMNKNNEKASSKVKEQKATRNDEKESSKAKEQKATRNDEKESSKVKEQKAKKNNEKESIKSKEKITDNKGENKKKNKKIIISVVILTIIVLFGFIMFIIFKTNDVKSDNSVELEIPTSGLGETLPKIKSTNMNIVKDNDKEFQVEIGDFTEAQFNEYVIDCQNKGFINEGIKYNDQYFARNTDGLELDLKYDGNKIINIYLKDTNDENTRNKNNRIKNDIKEIIKNYDTFIDEYVSYMNKYKNASDEEQYLKDLYNDYEARYSKETEKFNSLKDRVLNKEERVYYSEIQEKVNNRLQEILN